MQTKEKMNMKFYFDFICYTLFIHYLCIIKRNIAGNLPVKIHKLDNGCVFFIFPHNKVTLIEA